MKTTELISILKKNEFNIGSKNEYWKYWYNPENDMEYEIIVVPQKNKVELIWKGQSQLMTPLQALKKLAELDWIEKFPYDYQHITNYLPDWSFYTLY